MRRSFGAQSGTHEEIVGGDDDWTWDVRWAVLMNVGVSPGWEHTGIRK